MRSYFALLVLVVVVSSIGCRGYRTPFNSPAGTYRQQRFEAVAHDPYPQDELGPEVVGARPRDYQKPVAEPVRDKLYHQKRHWFRN